MAKDNKKNLLVAQEVKLVKILAGNNKKLRERTIKRLGKWLSDRTVSAPLTEEALMRIWKGLFYAMWMSDKPLIQEDCAEKIANLVHLNDVNSSLLYFKCFLQTMVNEWYGIDHYRIEKFLMLIRRVLRQILEVLHQEKWQDEHINIFREILNQTVLKIDKNTALGLCLQIDEIFLEELAKVSSGEISSEKILELIQPFAQQLARVEDSRQIQHINNYIFKHLINQTDVAIEYREKFHAWRRQGFPGGSLDAMEEILLEDDENVDSEVHDHLDNLDNDPLEESAENDVQNNLENGAKDPRAGKVDVVLPQLQFDPASVARLLEELKFKKYTTSNGRKTIGKLVKQFNLLAEGIYPFGLTKINLSSNGISVKSSVQRLRNFNKSLTHDSKKAKSKALKQKKIKEVLLEQLKQHKTNKTCLKNNKNKETNTNKKQKPSETLEEFIQKSEGHLFKQNTDKKQKKKRKLNVENEEKNVSSPEKITKKQKTPETKLTKKQNYFKRNSGVWTVDEFEVPESPKTSEWEKPLKNGETEIFVVSKKSKKKLKRLAESKNRPISEIETDFVEKIMYATPNRSSIVKNPFSGPTTPRSEKKIKFSTKIDAQEFREHQKNIINSPIIPYDGSKMPTKSLLKQSPFTSPINPFYNLNNK